MYYELYIDQFFLEHLLTDGLLLALTALLCRSRLRAGRLLAGSAAGAAVMTFLICTGCVVLWPLSLTAAGVAAFWRRGEPCPWEKLLALLFVTCCFGGVLGALTELFGLPVLWMAAGAGCALWYGIAWLYRKRKRAAGTALVTIWWGERQVQAEGLIDTGNHLREPLTGHPVSILSRDTAEELLGAGWEARKGFFLIPYHTIGRKQGWMRAVAVDRMAVTLPRGGDGQEALEISAPILAISEGVLSETEHYRMILHPMHVEDAGCSRGSDKRQIFRKDRRDQDGS